MREYGDSPLFPIKQLIIQIQLIIKMLKKLKNKGLDIKEISELTGLMETETNEIIK